MKPPCVCKCDLDHPLFLCLLTAPCICFCASWPLPVFGCASAAALIAGVSRRNPRWRFRTLCKLSPSLPLRCPAWSTTKHKYKNTWMWNTIWHFNFNFNFNVSQLPNMGDGYRLWWWNKTLQETEVFLGSLSDLSPIIVAKSRKIVAVLLDVVQMRGGWPCPNFLSPFHKCFFWSIKRVYFLQKANNLNFKLFI